MNRRTFVAIFCVACLGVTACSGPDNNPVVGNNVDDNADNNILDAGNNQPDATDTGGTDDCRTADICAEEQVCNQQTGECVDCVSDNECGDNAVCNPDTNACECDDGFHDCSGECVDSTSTDHCGETCDPCPTDPNGTATCDGEFCALVCNTDYVIDIDTDTCVQCLENSDCNDASASACDAGTCVACTENADCSHITDADTCRGDGMCVECTTADDSVCAGNSCDPASGTCTTTQKASVGVCEVCAADSECMADHRCVPMQFEGVDRAVAFCLPVADGGCDGLYGVSVNRTSLSGVTDDYCTINEGFQTCEALADYGNGCADNSDCGAAGIDDGLCEPIDFEPAACTVACEDFGQCPSGSLIGCATGGLNGEKWCGAY